MYAVPGLKFKENNWLYFWTVLVPRFGDMAFFLGKIMENNELIQLTDRMELKKCPVCGARKDQMCSIPDPDRKGFGIELTNYIHRERDI
jgi:hypothetical protein